MSSLANIIVALWFLPVALQIVLPLAVLIGGLGYKLIGKVVGEQAHSGVVHSTGN